jgi:Ca2+-binding EF-hand superfamily protein
MVTKVVWSGVVLMACLATAGTAVAAGAVQKPRQRMAARFKALDTNHDGAISRDEWTRRPKAFDRLDADHNNLVTPQELRSAARKGVARRHAKR